MLSLAVSGLGKVTAHFKLRWRYRGMGSWMCQISQEGRQVTGRGDYILSTNQDSFVKAGVR